MRTRLKNGRSGNRQGAFGHPNRLIKRSFLAVTTILVFFPCIAKASGGESGTGLDLVSAIGLAIVASSVLVVVFNLLRLPALLAYIVSGLVLGALASEWLADSEGLMEHISHLGLVFLLFIIGLEMDLRGILRFGPRTAIAVLLQAPIAVGAVLGVQYAASAFGLTIPGLGDHGPSFFYFAVACALGSTAVVVKLLGDKFDLDSKAGKITVITLIAQDIWAVVALSYATSTTGGRSASLVLMLGGGLGVTVALVCFARWVLARVMATISKAPDLMALVAIGWCFVCTHALSVVGLSGEMGALIAGLTVGALPHRVDVLTKVLSLRDFFMALFFVALGMSLPSPNTGVILQSLALVGIVILVRMLLFTPTLFVAKLGPVVSLAAPINLSQLSEFSLLLVPIGVGSGALSTEHGAVISYAMMLSIMVTSFAVANNYRLARLIGRALPGRGRLMPGDKGAVDADPRVRTADIVMLGFHHNAEVLAKELRRTSPELISRLLVLDYNLQNHRNVRAHGLRVAYGDISNPETLRHHGIARAQVVISTISNTFLRGTSNQALAEQVRYINPRARFIATADDERTASVLRGLGVFRVVVPPVQAASVFIQALEAALSEKEKA